MTEITFHFNVANTTDYACRLLRKAYKAKARVVVKLPPVLLKTLDEALWTFSATEFLPHCSIDSPAEQLVCSPIVLAHSMDTETNLPHHQVLVNLMPDHPDGFEKFEKLIEIVPLDTEHRQQARQRWKYYTERGYPIKTHDASSQNN
jgi:DNA polymerase-3 subunit chi